MQTPMDEGGQFILIQPGARPAAGPEPSPGKNPVVVPPPSPPAAQRSREPRSLSDSEPPTLDIRGFRQSPTVFVDRLYIEGRAQEESGVQSITVNGEKVLKRPGKNVYFNHTVPLAEGPQRLTVVCTDTLGNETRREIEVTRKKPAVFDTGARMVTAFCPLSAVPTPQGIRDAMTGELMESSRFSLKEWPKGAVFAPAGQEGADQAAAEEARKMGADFVLILSDQKVRNTLQIAARMVETRSLDILTHEDVYGEDAMRDDEVTPDLVRTLCRGLVLKLCDALPVVEGKVIKVKGREVILNAGENHRLKKGMHLVFYTEGEPIQDPDTGQPLGVDTEELGKGRIDKFQQALIYAQLMDDEAAQRLKPGLKFVTQ